MSLQPVHFFLPESCVADDLLDLDPDRDWRRFATGEFVWILQTYLRLRERGWVALSSSPPDDALVVFHAKHRRELARLLGCAGRRVLVGVRADSSCADLADLEVLQNGRFADGASRFAVPHWPQPGLVPRDPARGSRLERAAYKGFARNLHPSMQGSAWLRALVEAGIEWEEDAAAFAGPGTDASALAWNDYSEIDAVVAVRRPDRRLHREKPASKLINCWAAGVPAVLGPEVAYRELRRSELDYLEAGDAASALSALGRLRSDPALYQAMVANGRERARDFTPARICELWSDLLRRTIPARAAAAGLPRPRRTPLRLVALRRRLARWLRAIPAR